MRQAACTPGVEWLALPGKQCEWCCGASPCAAAGRAPEVAFHESTACLTDWGSCHALTGTRCAAAAAESAQPLPHPLSCSYAFQWWLLPPSEGGAGPGLIDEPYAIVCAITAIFLFVMLGVMCVLSVPYVRRNHHNLFELSHRYVGWSLLGILWIHVTVKAAYWANYNALGQELPQSQKVGAAGCTYTAWPGVACCAAVGRAALRCRPLPNAACQSLGL